MKKLLLVLLFLSGLGFGQSQVVVTGQVQDPSGTVATSGYIQFDISPQNSSIQYTIPGVATLGTQSVRCGIDTSGFVKALSLNGPCLLWGNDLIVPQNTLYQVTFAPGNLVTNTVPNEQITGTTYNLNNPQFGPIVRIFPQSASLTTPPVNANIVPLADSIFSIGLPLFRYSNIYSLNVTSTSLVGSNLQLTGITFANLPTTFSDGTLLYCSDCTIGTTPCTVGGTGSFAQHINGVWACSGGGGGAGGGSVNGSGALNTLPVWINGTTLSNSHLTDDNTNVYSSEPFVRDSLTFSNLPVGASNGSTVYCTDCTLTVPCTGGGTGATADFINNQWNCVAGASSTASVTNVTATSPVTSSGGATPNVALAVTPPNQAIIGPCTYGSSAAIPTGRLLCPQDIPGQTVQAIDNASFAGPIDASGNPTLLTASGTNIVVSCTTVNQSYFISGKYFTCAADVTLPVTGAAGVIYVYAKYDTASNNLIGSDYITSTIPILHSYPSNTPTCSNGSNLSNGNGGFYTAASATNPHYWFNLGTNATNICVSSGGAFVAACPSCGNKPSIFVGECWWTGAAVGSCLSDPFGMAPGRRFSLFGDGSSGNLASVAGGTVIKDGFFQFNSLVISGAGSSVTHDVVSAANPIPGLVSFSQLPVMVINSGTISVVGKGRASTPNTVANGAAGQNCGLGGSGAFGGGGTVGTGGFGGDRELWFSWAQLSFVSNHNPTAVNTLGINGQASSLGFPSSSNIPQMREAGWALNGCGASGGGGGGDGAGALGGNAGNGGGSVMTREPSLLVDATSSIKCDGAAGSNGATPGTNLGTGGGAGGGAGSCINNAGFFNILGTVTASGGLGGLPTNNGTGIAKAGGVGGSGVAQNNKIF